jgi:S-adenosylmethionine:tRNA-ribosyltransferase-isomerase (queuine synthetase)
LFHVPCPFRFSVALDGLDESAQQLENKLFDAGCGDALLTSHDALVVLDFHREAKSLSNAVASAIDDIQAAGYRIISIGVGDRAFDGLTAELSSWQAASDEDFESFASGLE